MESFYGTEIRRNTHTQKKNGDALHELDVATSVTLRSRNDKRTMDVGKKKTRGGKTEEENMSPTFTSTSRQSRYKKKNKKRRKVLVAAFRSADAKKNGFEFHSSPAQQHNDTIPNGAVWLISTSP